MVQSNSWPGSSWMLINGSTATVVRIDQSDALAAIGEYAQAEKVYDRLARQKPDDAVARAKRTTMGSLAAQAMGSSSSDAA